MLFLGILLVLLVYCFSVRVAYFYWLIMLRRSYTRDTAELGGFFLALIWPLSWFAFWAGKGFIACWNAAGNFGKYLATIGYKS